MKNKKGFLLAEETLKIVIALIAISFLIYFLSSLYFNSQKDEKLEFAKASLEHLMEEINSIEEGKPKDVEIYNPEGWVVVSWPYLDEKLIPNSCSNFKGKSCICICKDLKFGEALWSKIPFLTDSQREVASNKCDKKGICMENSKSFIVKGEVGEQSPIFIKPPLILKIENKIISKNEFR
ncbi:hypothetical protein CMI39_02685 [Candidatus Pacearchaeota archaeon]|jgi:hypothetical protein|nr:hypothetical protein [Candidatus Pacearchaeota archaeon]|tara:strand:+ start:2004 stop:2543 length:540 start_codon:yes stop_codon:yes gene_type:complete